MTKNMQSTEFKCAQCESINKIPYRQLMTLNKSPRCGNCSQPLLRAFEQPFDDLDPNAYIHAHDREALAALQKLPGVDTLLRNLIQNSFELATRLHHEANFIRVSKRQLPKLYAHLVFAHEQLGMSELPELYVYQDNTPNAYTFGVEKNSIAISSGALDLLDDEEVVCVLSHELGHIHAEHVLYRTASRVLGAATGAAAQATFGLGGVVTYPIQAALSRWERTSELSADRAALLVVKNPSIVVRTLMKLAGGSAKFVAQLNMDAFIEQAESFENIKEEGPLGKFITLFDTVFRSHPYPIWRSKELIDWTRKGNFLEVLNGVYAKRTKVVDVEPRPPQDTDPVAQGVRDFQDWYRRNFSLG